MQNNQELQASIKQNAGVQKQSNLNIQGGHGIVVNGDGNNWSVSLEQQPPTKVTVQVCVDGTLKNLDVYAFGQPY